MKIFSSNDYIDALLKMGILLLTYLVVVIIVEISLKWTAFSFEAHIQNPLLVMSSLVVLYLIVLLVVKKTK